jgi:hypothetical protein
MGFSKILDSNPARVASKIADLAQSFGLILGLIGAVGGICVSWLVTQGLRLDAALAVGAVAAVVALGGAGLVYYIRVVHDPDDYVIEEMAGQLTVRRTLQTNDRFLYRYEYSRSQRVRATRNNLRLIQIRSHWSGQSISVTDVASCFPEHKLLDGGIAEEDGRVYRWIYLLGAVGRGRRVTVGIRQAFEDAFVPMKPYFRESGEDRRVEKLVVRLRFRADEAPDEAWLVTWRRAGSGTGRQEVARERCQPVREQGSDLVLFETRQRRPRSDCAHGFVWRWPVPESGAPVPQVTAPEAEFIGATRPGRRRRRP